MVDLELAALEVLLAADLPAVAELPAPPARPVVLVSAAGGPPSRSGAPDWLLAGDLQLDVWAETKADAADIAALARAALLAAPRNPDPDASVVVTSVNVNHPSWTPDEDWPASGRPGPRYVVLVTMSAHPKE